MFSQGKRENLKRFDLQSYKNNTVPTTKTVVGEPKQYYPEVRSFNDIWAKNEEKNTAPESAKFALFISKLNI